MYRKPSLLFALSVAVLTTISIAAQEQDDLVHRNYGLYSEKMIRNIVVSSVMPEIPEEALMDDAQGKIVVAVVFDEGGKFLTAEVLESPHPGVKRSVLDALKEWRVAPRSSIHGMHKLVAWLTFDCVIRNGVGRIEYAAHDDHEYKQDRRYRHPFVKGSMAFFYRYQ